MPVPAGRARPAEGLAMSASDDGHTIPEERRREIFAALVEAQDQRMSVAESRAAIAERFGVSVDQVRAIEREGLTATWPPLE
jgi:chromosomal replication initiation ATPase DnaA